MGKTVEKKSTLDRLIEAAFSKERKRKRKNENRKIHKCPNCGRDIIKEVMEHLKLRPQCGPFKGEKIIFDKKYDSIFYQGPNCKACGYHVGVLIELKFEVL